MTNLTLRVDERTLDEARRIAAQEATSVNSLIRTYLEDLVQRKSQAAQAREELRSLFARSTAQSGITNWSREDLHER